MTYLERARDLYEKMHQGQMMEAFEAYYADDVVVEEKPTGEVRKGKEAQRKALHAWVEMQEEMHGGGYGPVTSNEDDKTTMVESWVEATFKGGNRFKMEEVAVQKWNDDGQIVHEAFFYQMPEGAQM